MPPAISLSRRLREISHANRATRGDFRSLANAAEDLEGAVAVTAVENGRLLRAQATRASVTEPLTYREGGEHSFFYDLARARRMNDKRAQARLDQHKLEMDTELPHRAEARARIATTQYEAAFAADRAGYEALNRMTSAGVNPFERRAISRTDAQGGYLSPPIYLLDRYVPFAREASPFASAWTTLDLPLQISEINVPRLAVGAAVGPQSDAGPVPTRDIQDSLVTAPVKTIAGNADAARSWLEQGQGANGYGVDDMLYADLTADLATNLDGQCLLGSGSGQQLLGVWPAGAIAAANGIVVADSNNATGQTWTVASAGSSLHVQSAQLVSLLRRLRARADGLAWYWHPWTWSLYAAQVDSQGRPLVNSQNVSGLPDGAVGEYQNIPVYCDANIPTTTGGTIAPYIGTITNGQYAAIPGSGAGASYTPLLLARPSDLFVFSGEIQLQILTEVLSGSGQVRFQAHQYHATMPNRYVAAAATGSNVSAGGDVAHATLTWQQSNSLLILSGSGY
jgi:HK97 family phage major capsid protein